MIYANIWTLTRYGKNDDANDYMTFQMVDLEEVRKEKKNENDKEEKHSNRQRCD